MKGVPLFQHIADLADTSKLSLPIPAFNFVNGGKRAGNKLPFQEFLVLPSGASSFADAMRLGHDISLKLHSLIKAKYGSDAVLSVGLEGGFSPAISSNQEAFEVCRIGVEQAGAQDKCQVAVDVASYPFYQEEKKVYDFNYKLDKNDGKGGQNPDAMAELLKTMVENYSVSVLEDPFEDMASWEHWSKLTEAIGKDVQIVADSLCGGGNVLRVAKAVEAQAANTVLLKLHQVGTLSEVVETAKLARAAGWALQVSGGTGETADDFVADLAVGLGASVVKFGGLARMERTAKYNQLLRIEASLKDKATYAGHPLVA